MNGAVWLDLLERGQGVIDLEGLAKSECTLDSDFVEFQTAKTRKIDGVKPSSYQNK